MTLRPDDVPTVPPGWARPERGLLAPLDPPTSLDAPRMPRGWPRAVPLLQINDPRTGPEACLALPVSVCSVLVAVQAEARAAVLTRLAGRAPGLARDLATVGGPHALLAVAAAPEELRDGWSLDPRRW